jgi:adenylate kinase
MRARGRYRGGVNRSSPEAITRVFVLGPPASGKTTQARRVADALDVPHISTGNTLREAVEGRTPLGARARAFMDRGELVPDEVVVAILGEQIAGSLDRGFVIDGFPRDPAQAEISAEVVGRPDLVIHLAITDDEVVRRVGGRRSCSSCGRIYHLTDQPSRLPDRCDDDARPLVRRVDDHPEVVMARLAVYREQTEPVIDRYRADGVVAEVDGSGEIAVVTERMLAALGRPNGISGAGV